MEKKEKASRVCEKTRKSGKKTHFSSASQATDARTKTSTCPPRSRNKKKCKRRSLRKHRKNSKERRCPPLHETFDVDFYDEVRAAAEDEEQKSLRLPSWAPRGSSLGSGGTPLCAGWSSMRFSRGLSEREKGPGGARQEKKGGGGGVGQRAGENALLHVAPAHLQRFSIFFLKAQVERTHCLEVTKRERPRRFCCCFVRLAQQPLFFFLSQRQIFVSFLTTHYHRSALSLSLPFRLVCAPRCTVPVISHCS